MSKSLKNFITIRQILEQYAGSTVRFLFLMQSWDGSMNFSSDALNGAKTKEKEFHEFFGNMSVAMRQRADLGAVSQVWDEEDRKLHNQYLTTRQSVHDALCDNFNYPSALQQLSELVRATNLYLRAVPSTYKTLILQQITRYIDHMLRIFGVMPDVPFGITTATSSSAQTAILDAISAFRDKVRELSREKAPHSAFLSAADALTDFSGTATNSDRAILNALYTFRDEVRSLATASSPHTAFLQACDRFRDGPMIDCGVRLEDVTGGASVWKLDDPVKLRREREDKKREEAAQRLQKSKNKVDKLRKDIEKLQDSAASPSYYFAQQKDKYSAFDAEGRPTHDAEGKELSKSALKGIQKNMGYACEST